MFLTYLSTWIHTHTLHQRVHFKMKSQSKLFDPLNANPTKWPNTLKKLVGKSPTNCLSVFDHFVELRLKGLMYLKKISL